MTREERFSKTPGDGRRSASRTTAARPAARRQSTSRSWAGRSSTKKKARSPRSKASAEDSQRLAIANPELYRPLKRPITLRLDADVLAWFKKDGRRYQTRINQALRQVMEREMKSSHR